MAKDATGAVWVSRQIKLKDRSVCAFFCPKPEAAPNQPIQIKRFSTVAEAQQEALRLYPALGVAGSPFNREFVARHKKYQMDRPDYFRVPGWPVALAREVDAVINPK